MHGLHMSMVTQTDVMSEVIYCGVGVGRAVKLG